MTPRLEQYSHISLACVLAGVSHEVKFIQKHPTIPLDNQLMFVLSYLVFLQLRSFFPVEI